MEFTQTGLQPPVNMNGCVLPCPVQDLIDTLIVRYIIMVEQVAGYITGQVFGPFDQPGTGVCQNIKGRHLCLLDSVHTLLKHFRFIIIKLHGRLHTGPAGHQLLDCRDIDRCYLHQHAILTDQPVIVVKPLIIRHIGHIFKNMGHDF